MALRTVSVGCDGLQSSVIGLGCMGMSEFYGEPDDAQSLRTLERAFELLPFFVIFHYRLWLVGLVVVDRLQCG
jgi:hypothetical protein